jgi:hypothetical protein
MRSEEYRRIHDVCHDMAQQSDSEDLHDRWLKLAEYWLDRAGEADVIKPQRINALSLHKHGATFLSPPSFAIH